MEKCYVDGHFRVTQRIVSRKAIVTENSNSIEITFLEPIAFRMGMSEAWKFMKDWGKRNYPRYSFYFPRLEVSLIANADERKPLIYSCYTSTCFRKKGQQCYYSLNEEGKSVEEPLIAERIYVSFLMHPGEFYFLNPGVDLSKYQTRRYV